MSAPKFLSTAMLAGLVLYNASPSLAQSGIQACPLLGPVYPAPTALQDDATFTAAAANLTQQLQNATSTGQTRWGSLSANVTSFSAGVFSLDDPELVFAFDWNAPDIQLLPAAKQTTDSDTIYIINSISKLVTVYAVLTEVGDSCWDEPVTKYIPELAQAVADYAQHPDSVNQPRWQDVTVGDLASQLGGGPHFTAAQINYATPVPGLPPPTPVQCTSILNCTRQEFFANFVQYPPIEAPGTTAIYSDDAFQLLAWALEGMSGKDFLDVVQDNVFTPLGLAHSSAERPPNDEVIITVASDMGLGPVGGHFSIDTPSGGFWSSVNDLASLGRSILNSTLLPPALTQRWLKPRSHTASLVKSVGAPWEINRAQVNGRTVDLYCKEGDSGEFTAWLCLLPDFNAGISLAAVQGTTDASETFGIVNDGKQIMNLIGDIMLPALDNAAQSQAATKLAGTYEGDNATVTLSVSPDVPGLNITSWESDGADILAAYAAVSGAPAALPLQVTSVRSAEEIAFRIVPQQPADDTPPGIFLPQCDAWEGMDPNDRNGQPIDLFVFTVDGDGNAVSVAPRILGDKVLNRSI